MLNKKNERPFSDGLMYVKFTVTLSILNRKIQQRVESFIIYFILHSYLLYRMIK